MAPSLGVGRWVAVVASPPPVAEAESDWAMLERAVYFFPWGKCFAVRELMVSGMVCTWAYIPGSWAHAPHV